MSENHIKFLGRMLGDAKDNEAEMSSLNAIGQAKFVCSELRQRDAGVLLYKETAALGGYEVCVLKGADVLAAEEGVVLNTITGQGIPRPRKIVGRPIFITAFLVKNRQEAEYFELAFGDSTHIRRFRRREERKDGPSAVVSIQMAAHPTVAPS